MGAKGRPGYPLAGGALLVKGTTLAPRTKVGWKMEEGDWKKNCSGKMMNLFSSHGGREGEAPTVLLEEGATQAPIHEEGVK